MYSSARQNLAQCAIRRGDSRIARKCQSFGGLRAYSLRSSARKNLAQSAIKNEPCAARLLASQGFLSGLDSRRELRALVGRGSFVWAIHESPEMQSRADYGHTPCEPKSLATLALRALLRFREALAKQSATCLPPRARGTACGERRLCRLIILLASLKVLRLWRYAPCFAFAKRSRSNLRSRTCKRACRCASLDYLNPKGSASP